MSNTKKIFIVAGEASGDIIGANLVQSMQDIKSDIAYEICGIGGEMMQLAGVKLLFHYKKIAVIGFLEVVFSYLELSQHMKKAIAAIIEYKPDLIITIDSPGFNFRLIKALRNFLDFKTIHYVAPTVWAYDNHRAQLVHSLYQHIFLILPFESKYFEHMPHTFVGHPIVEDNTCLLKESSIEQIFVKDLTKLDSKEWIISVLPGSRKSEIKRHIKTLVKSIKDLNETYKDKHKLKFNFLILPHLKSFLESYIDDDQLDIEIHADVNKHNEIIQKSVLGLVKCGTSTMRFMANGTPAVTFYKISSISAYIIKRRLKISSFNLCNIIMESDLLPELIQEKFTAKNIFESAVEMLSIHSKRHRIINLYIQIWNRLYQNEKPSKKAAKKIFEYLKK